MRDQIDDTLQVCRIALTVEKETAIVGMSQKARLARAVNFFVPQRALTL
jgi:3-dehydroquinate dehydratase